MEQICNGCGNQTCVLGRVRIALLANKISRSMKLRIIISSDPFQIEFKIELNSVFP